MRIVAVITERSVITKILAHLALQLVVLFKVDVHVGLAPR